MDVVRDTVGSLGKGLVRITVKGTVTDMVRIMMYPCATV